MIRILEIVARSDSGVTLAELSHQLGAPRSSVHGFVGGLVAEGYLAEAEGQGRYVFGLGAHTLLASTSTSLVELLSPVMTELNEQLDETITLAVPVGRELAYVESLRSSQPITYSPVLHQRRSLWPTSAGKIFLAYGALGCTLPEGDPGGWDEIFGAGTVEELEAIRRSGCATNIGESVTDVAAVAVGVRIGGQLVAALSLGGPRARIEPRLERIARLAQQLLAGRDLG